MIRRVSWLLLLIALLAPAAPTLPGAAAADPAGAPPPLPPPPSAAEAARLAAGEVLLASRRAPPWPLAEEMGRGIVDAPPERVFAAVTDLAHYQEWVPFVQRSDAAPKSDGSVVSFQSLALPFPLGRRYYKIRARGTVSEEGGGRVWRAWWRYLPGTGNVADHHGWWVLVPFGEGRTLGACLLYTDPGHGVPAWAVHRGTAETMPYVFSGLRQQVRRSRYDRP
jgi:hypothetical protein